jgi:hypothetical protein
LGSFTTEEPNREATDRGPGGTSRLACDAAAVTGEAWRGGEAGTAADASRSRSDDVPTGTLKQTNGMSGEMSDRRMKR